jgi:hypothetical protein
LTGLNPRTFSRKGKWSFSNERRKRYLAQCGGSPSIVQSTLIENLISLEWSALAAEKLAEGNPGNLTALRESREHRRLFQRFLTDFERATMGAPPPKARFPRPGPVQLAVDEHLAKIRERQGDEP